MNDVCDVQGQHPHSARGEGERDDREPAGAVLPGGPGLGPAPPPLAGPPPTNIINLRILRQSSSIEIC